MSSTTHLVVFDTHPIQYRSPVFRQLHREMDGLKVFFFESHYNGNRWWFREVNKNPVQPFGLPLSDGFKSEVLHTSRRGWRGTYRLIREKLLATRPDSVLIYGYYLVEHWLVWWACRRLGIPLLFVGETFSSDGRGARAWLRRILLRVFFDNVSGVIAIGERSRSYYEKLGLAENKIALARYCVDNDFFSLPPDRSEQVRSEGRKKLQIPENALVVLFVGRLFDRKRPLDVIELQRRVASLGVHTLMVGNGELQKSLEETGRDVPGLHFLGFRNQAEVKDLYHVSDILYVPSEFETWGLVVNEAYAAGMTAIVTETCGVAHDLVVSKETGFICEVGDVDSAQAAVLSCLDQPKRLAEIRHRAKQRTLRDYSIDQFAQAIRRVALRPKKI